ncbi:hypothetical protein [Paenibacillus nasutitermitis]|uniref:Uncharacterized protein n=1 Tax=Paenibacillus nasutitermitis TaxID=1652958 RepID=A0A916YX93_9BACL|nr:hypothetical protein [Paenibacillus nasutitermitis]GGD65667.1 hypothetical protein GCM10010911_24300 [Paenibacillus nasutitermitis]
MEVRQGHSLQHPVAGALYMVVLLLLGKLLFPLDEQMGIIIFFALMIPFFFFLLRWPNTPGALFGGLCVMLAGKLVYALTTDPLSGPDEIHYYEQVSTFERLSDFMPYAWNHLVTEWANISAYPMFGLLYMPLFKWLELQDPLPIIMLNSLLLLLLVNQTYRLNEQFFRYEMEQDQRLRFHSYMIAGLLISPSFMLLSSVFAKDVTCALLGLYGAGLLLRRKYLWFIVLIIYATGLRDYSIVYTLGFYFLYGRKFKSAAAIMLLAMAVLALQIGPLGLLNSGMLTVFLFMSPNPVNVVNWDSELLFRTLEALWLSVGLGLGILNFLRFKETRPFYLIAAMLLFTYACTLSLVGYVTITGRDLEYGVGTVGDNMVRKKLPVLPMLYIVHAYSFVWGRKWFRKSAALPSIEKGGLTDARP